MADTVEVVVPFQLTDSYLLFYSFIQWDFKNQQRTYTLYHIQRQPECERNLSEYTISTR